MDAYVYVCACACACVCVCVYVCVYVCVTLPFLFCSFFVCIFQTILPPNI
eukprot:m.130287 g.130287  ORF g.130287 m.130287 type:complete len:50 (-) comp29468_c1_seq2:33-182(-)